MPINPLPYAVCLSLLQTAVDAGHSPAWAAAVIGPMFVAAHVPLYLPGQLYEGLPLWPLPISLLAGAVLLTWLYLRTGGSVLVAGLMHGALNATVPLTWGLDDVWVWQARAVVIGVIAVLVVLMSGVQWWRSSYRLGFWVGQPSTRRRNARDHNASSREAPPRTAPEA